MICPSFHFARGICVLLCFILAQELYTQMRYSRGSRSPEHDGTDPTPWSGIGFMLANRHFGNPNVLYIDGHVKFRRRDDIYDKGIGDPNSEWVNGN